MERYHHSPTIPNIFQTEIDECLKRLKTEFDIAAHSGSTRTIWPRMVLYYKPDDNDGVNPVWGPIKDSNGYILGIKVVPKNRKTNVYLEWHPPEPD